MEKDQPSLTLSSPVNTKKDNYVLTAAIDPRFYCGTCEMGGTTVPEAISGNILTCPLDFGSQREGEISVDVTISSAFGKDYEFEFDIRKDTSPPALRFVDLENKYTAAGAKIKFSATDGLLDEASVVYSFEDGEKIAATVDTDGTYSFVVPDTLCTGRHIVAIAADTLGNENTFQADFILVKDRPSLSFTSGNRTSSATYHLRAELDPASYCGTYTPKCAMDGDEFAATISRENIPSCSLNIASPVDGALPIEVVLAVDSGEDYTFILNPVKDTAPPSILCDFASSYGAGGVAVFCSIADGDPLPSPADYAARLGYNWKATSNLRGDINIKYTKPDLLGNPDMSSVLEFERRENLNEITTDGRFTVLPGAP